MTAPRPRIEWRGDPSDEARRRAQGLVPSARVFPWLVTYVGGREHVVRITHEQAALIEAEEGAR
ncbi:MAG TPA: hypothetical protein VIY73_04495 [Polyangiaceae bacterium]